MEELAGKRSAETVPWAKAPPSLGLRAALPRLWQATWPLLSLALMLLPCLAVWRWILIGLWALIW